MVLLDVLLLLEDDVFAQVVAEFHGLLDASAYISDIRVFAVVEVLVSENSRLRLHHSFMPIRYREEMERMQQQDAQLYREQRRVPKVISPQDTDNHAGTIKLVEAPRAHEMVRRYAEFVLSSVSRSCTCLSSTRLASSESYGVSC